ncbi:YceI family protein [Halobacteriovorax sp. JY17]|uniref:YceI family protein n=1 Tax=Halobacteriovorax sp. JY17 TaxID=2014617 RepID=UPI000C66E52E|nr:YceI family protein [Halobacteriovorax sp. JY17]PIK14863.1 MAG: hypothetical protein CES88_11060 [Halobacteriovorax sp. JY17]
MKNTILILYILLSTNIFAENFQGEVSSKTFHEAKEKKSRLQFIVVSTKAGMFSSDVDGYVKTFSYQSEFDSKNLILRNMKINFKASSMDTDGGSRDEKLHNLCMDVSKFPKVEISVGGPLFLKDSRKRSYNGTVKIRGKEKKFQIELSTTRASNDTYQIKGSSTWSLKEMGIPDPSIFIAKLSDEIKINILINESIK